ncbi:MULTISPECIES: hypothetical protein [Shewanella]|uniref:Lipoprotein n=2 Tax=Shewanella TaxID=22 RepID=A0AAJ1BHS0_9GAMM|nr:MULTISPECIES: hypothetical protein [Shewanella]AZQ11621.1 hypothetical protein STH12_02552 [Shewanella khirikhana]MCH4294942.1 hypothetical protein [Shewanella zhuhaiensis]
MKKAVVLMGVCLASLGLGGCENLTWVEPKPAKEVNQPQIPEQDGMVQDNERILEEARRDGRLNR